jgi:hypothetical protein
MGRPLAAVIFTSVLGGVAGAAPFVVFFAMAFLSRLGVGLRASWWVRDA